jgi:hypothetical protein
MVVVLAGGGVVLAWGVVQIVFAERLSRWYSRMHRRLGGGLWARLLVAEPENSRLNVRLECSRPLEGSY